MTNDCEAYDGLPVLIYNRLQEGKLSMQSKLRWKD